MSRQKNEQELRRAGFSAQDARGIVAGPRDPAHRVRPLDGHDDTWRCACGEVFVSESGFAICPRASRPAGPSLEWEDISAALMTIGLGEAAATADVHGLSVAVPTVGATLAFAAALAVRLTTYGLYCDCCVSNECECNGEAVRGHGTPPYAPGRAALRKIAAVMAVAEASEPGVITFPGVTVRPPAEAGDLVTYRPAVADGWDEPHRGRVAEQPGAVTGAGVRVVEEPPGPSGLVHLVSWDRVLTVTPRGVA
jgi:hypothetical protein